MRVKTENEINSIDKDYKPIVRKLTYELNHDKCTLEEIGGFNEYIEKPIIRLPDNRLFIPVPFGVSEALYEAPFFWMKSFNFFLLRVLSMILGPNFFLDN